MSKDPMGIAPLVRFIMEREAIRVRKEKGLPRPWTKDPILNKYRFCNVRREDDSVTRWLRDNWYSRYSGNPDVWFAAVVARLFNNPESLDEIGIQRKLVLPFRPERMRQVLHERAAAGEKNFNAAYIVSTNGVAMDKVDYVVIKILGLLWAERKNMRPKPGDTLDVYHRMLMGFDGLGSFIAAQVVADLKYMESLKPASDWWSFAASGPGSRRGLNRVCGRPPTHPWQEANWRGVLGTLLSGVNRRLATTDFGQLHAQDLQNCLCEFDKYERARLGEGTPKQIYKEKNNA